MGEINKILNDCKKEPNNPQNRRRLKSLAIGLMFAAMVLTGCGKKEASEKVIRKIQEEIEVDIDDGKDVKEDVEYLIEIIDGDLRAYEGEGIKLSIEQQKEQEALQVCRDISAIILGVETSTEYLEKAAYNLDHDNLKLFREAMVIAIANTQDAEKACEDLENEHEKYYNSDKKTKDWVDKWKKQTQDTKAKVENQYYNYFLDKYKDDNDKRIADGKSGLPVEEMEEAAKETNKAFFEKIGNVEEKLGFADWVIETLENAFGDMMPQEITEALEEYNKVEEEAYMGINNLIIEKAEKRAMEANGEEEQNSSGNNKTNNSGNVVTDALRAAGEGIGKGAQAAGEGVGKGAETVGNAGAGFVNRLTDRLNQEADERAEENSTIAIARLNEEANDYLQKANEARNNGDDETADEYMNEYYRILEEIGDAAQTYKDANDITETRNEQLDDEYGEMTQ